MASLSYDEILSSFLGDITDVKFVKITEDEAYDMLHEYLRKVIAEPYVGRLFSSKELDEYHRVFTYGLVTSQGDYDDEFVLLMLTKWLKYEWIQNKVNSTNLTAQFFGTKEQKYYSQKEHLSGLRALRDDTLCEARNIIAERGFIAGAKGKK